MKRLLALSAALLLSCGFAQPTPAHLTREGVLVYILAGTGAQAIACPFPRSATSPYQPPACAYLSLPELDTLVTHVGSTLQEHADWDGWTTETRVRWDRYDINRFAFTSFRLYQDNVEYYYEVGVADMAYWLPNDRNVIGHQVVSVQFLGSQFITEAGRQARAESARAIREGFQEAARLDAERREAERIEAERRAQEEAERIAREQLEEELAALRLAKTQVFHSWAHVINDMVRILNSFESSINIGDENYTIHNNGWNCEMQPSYSHCFGWFEVPVHFAFPEFAAAVAGYGFLVSESTHDVRPFGADSQSTLDRTSVRFSHPRRETENLSITYDRITRPSGDEERTFFVWMDRQH